MFGYKRHNNRCGERFDAAPLGRPGRQGRHGGGHGGRGHGDFGGGGMRRGGRMMAQGDLRLLALALIAEQPRHGYEIIKLLEDKTGGWYSPSPGVVYPTLTYLEETCHVTSQADGAKRLYSITDDGRTYLEANRSFVDAVMQRLDRVGEKMRERSEVEDRESGRGPEMPRLIRAAIDNLREIAAERVRENADSEPRVVEALARAAGELKKL